jgi:hypothetical protein
VDDVPLSLLAETHELPGGERVRLRLTRPTDAPLVLDFLERTSAASDLKVRRYTFYDPRERMVLAAAMPADGGECIVGLADVEFGDAVKVVVDDERAPGLQALLTATGWMLAERRLAA